MVAENLVLERLRGLNESELRFVISLADKRAKILEDAGEGGVASIMNEVVALASKVATERIQLSLIDDALLKRRSTIDFVDSFMEPSGA